jgi:glycosyltransferase involved in cell wall biosynthesis
MRRVLLVTYDYPPVGGSGVQRIAKFAKYLPDFGWQPVVLTSQHGRIGPQDQTLLADVGQQEVHRIKAPDPHRWLTSLRSTISRETAGCPRGLHCSHLGPWHPAAWLVPDGKLPWIPFGVRWALGQRHRTWDFVLSTLPTPTAAILGSLISRAWDVPHVVDYRDPWTGAFYMPRRFPFLQRMEAALERRILASAAAVSAVPGVLEVLPRSNVPARVIHNGYDESDFSDAVPIRGDGRFVIAHVGILWRERDLSPLASAIDLLRQRLPDVSQRLQFIQVGRIDQFVAAQLERLGGTVEVTLRPSVTHREAIGYMLGADLLYLPTSHDHVPGKTYEYLRSGTPVLGLGGENSHLAKLIAETGGGRVVERSDCHEAAAFISDLMNHGQPYAPIEESRLVRYSRQTAAGALASLFDDVSRNTVAH